MAPQPFGGLDQLNHKAIAAKLAELDARVGEHDQHLAALVEASIKHKAHQWLGQITSVQHAERFRVYFLVGAPQAPELQESYQNALKILGKVPVDHEIVTEEAAGSFADRFGRLVVTHERAVAEDPPASISPVSYQLGADQTRHPDRR